MPADDIDIFISYAHADNGHDVVQARDIAQLLEDIGYKVFWDWKLLAGDVQAQLAQHAANASVTMALWSPNAGISKNVFFECQVAANRRTLLPVIIKDHPLPREWGHLLSFRLTDLVAQKGEFLLKLPPPNRDGFDGLKHKLSKLRELVSCDLIDIDVSKKLQYEVTSGYLKTTKIVRARNK